MCLKWILQKGENGGFGEMNKIPITHYYHEMGHALLCNVFDDSFQYVMLHFDKDTLLKVGDGKWEGALHVQGYTEQRAKDPITYFTKLVVIGFAGCLAENVYSEEFTDLVSLAPNWIEHPKELLNTDTIEGDWKTIIVPHSHKVVTIKQYPEFRKEVFRYIFNLLLDRNIYDMLKQVATDLYNTQSLKILGEDVIKTMEQKGLIQYLNEKKAMFMDDFTQHVNPRFRKY